eukprot:gene747-25_t
MAEITKIEKLNGSNYQSWKYNVKLLLMERGLWGFTQPDQERAPAEDAPANVRNAFRLRSDKAYSLIALNVEKDLQIHISSITDPLVAWQTLQGQFEFVSVTQIVRLSRKFYTESMEEGENLMKHLTTMTSLAEQLRELGEEISSRKFATVVLGSLPESYDNFLTSLNARAADGLDWENVKGSLIEEDMKRKEKEEKMQEPDNALFMKKGRGGWKHHGEARRGFQSGARGGRGGYHSNDGWNERHKDTKCWNCDRLGHFSRDCPNASGNRRNERANMADDTFSDAESEGIALISSTSDKQDFWFIDSGATAHMTNNKSILEHVKKYEEPKKIFLGNNTVIFALGEGTARLNTNDTDKFVLNLQRVLYVPKLTKNLLSVPAMASMGAEVRFDSERCIVLKDGKEFIIGTLYDKKLYKANVEHAAVAHAQLPNSETWHCRFGHLNHDYLNRMKKNEMVHGMDYTAAGNDKDCEACILGKMQKKRFPKYENKGKDTKHFEDKRRATRPFEIVHTDVCGPMQKSESDSMEYAILDKYLSSNFEENEDVPELPVYAENVEPVGENNGEPMGAQAPRQRTFEDNFMEQVRNLGATRERRPPVRFREELCNITGSLTSEVEEPKMVKDALSSEQSQHWQDAMNSEFFIFNEK